MKKAQKVLQDAGEKIAKAGENLEVPDAGATPSESESDSEPAMAGEQDPMMADEQDPMMAGDEDPMMAGDEDPMMAGDEDIASEPAGTLDDEIQSAQEIMAEAGGPMAGGPAVAARGPGDPGTPPPSGPEIDEEVAAAREALKKAGEALQKAGDVIGDAQSEEDLAEAEQAVANARIAVIIAGEDILQAKDILSQGDIDDGSVDDEMLKEAEEALEEANVAIVIAGNSILTARIELEDLFGLPAGMPTLSSPGQEKGEQGEESQSASSQGIPGGGPPRGRIGTLDDELEQSLIIFEGSILEARRTVLDDTPPPRSNLPPGGVSGEAESETGGLGDEVQIAVLSGDIDSRDDSGDMGADVPGPQGQTGNMRDASIGVAPPFNNNVPEDVPDGQGDDIVARQLREAALAETDPELREKLWEEYKRYKSGIGK